MSRASNEETPRMSTVRGRSFAVVKHTYYESPGLPETELVRWLSARSADAILYIRHPFPDASRIPPTTTVVDITDGGEDIRTLTAPHIPGPSVVRYAADVLLSVWYVLRAGRRFDLYVGADNLNAFAGIILRMLGRVRRVVFYVIDFTPERFANPLLNTIYRWINRFACHHADVIWNVSERMIEGREETGISRTRSAPQITVPLGCRFGIVRRRPTGEISPRDIAYFGDLREEHGPGLIIEALPVIAASEPEVHVHIIGDGPLRETLEARAIELGVAERVIFHGFVKSDEAAYRILTGCGLALATYPPTSGTYKTYSDPGKVKIYLAAGLPILITDVPPIARTIADRSAGVLVPYDPAGLSEAITALISDRARYDTLRENAVVLGSEFDWDAIWERTFAAMEEITG
jgi:glycosyltransferase involved in cell wall biosynthesis